jgi:hypothetical protein
VDLEVDDPEGEASLLEFLGGEPIDSLGWTSHRGPHRLFIVDGPRILDALADAGAKEGSGEQSGVYHLESLPGLEIRIGGHKSDGRQVKQVQSVCPPTIGTSGVRRQWNDCNNISRLPEASYSFLARIAEKRPSESPNGHVSVGCHETSSRVTSGSNFDARSALKEAAACVAAALKGSRHNVLLKESLPIASLVKADLLSAAEYLAGFEEADRANGHAADDPGDGEQVIRSALNIAQPIVRPSIKKGKACQSKGNHRNGRITENLDDDELEEAADLFNEPHDSVSANPAGSVHYAERAGHLYRMACGGKNGAEHLANFTARIVEYIERHDGNEVLKRFRIRAWSPKGKVAEIVIEADQYSTMTWVYDLGPEFALAPGRDTKDRARHAIQLFSTKAGIADLVEHTALGWIKYNGQYLYLHAAGAIGPEGHTDSVRVGVTPALSKYCLPMTPIAPNAILEAVDACLAIWELAKADRPGGQAAAALAATLPFRAVLSPFDAAAHFGGPSGNRKTSVARVAFQHFSTIARGRNSPMPAGWSDTPNALQRLLFDCRECLLIVDDMKFEKQVATAEIVFQAQGNLQNRARMRTDQRLQEGLDPRGSLLSTGEIDPRTRSALGRILTVEIQAGDVDLGVLSRLQEFGDNGLFATTMAAYIQWLAPQLDDIRIEHGRLVATIRQEIGDLPGTHSRHPDIVAQLLAAYQLFLRFAVECDAIAPLTAEGYLTRARQILIELGRAQSELQEESKPGRKFLDLIASALLAGRCHILNAQNDNAPSTYAGACGWQRDYVYQGAELGNMLDWKIPGNSKCIGFIDEEAMRVYLDPVECPAIATEMGKRLGDMQSFKSVGRELLNEGLCQAHVERGKVRSTRGLRIRSHGLKRYFWIPIEHIFGEVGANE